MVVVTLDLVRQVSHGQMRHGQVLYGTEEFGKAGEARQGRVWCVAVTLGLAWSGEAGSETIRGGWRQWQRYQFP